MKEVISFKSCVTGHFTRKQLLKFMLIAGLIFLTLFLTSLILFPKSLHYSILTHTISYLGDYTKNPSGWLFFSLSFIIIGLSFIPLILYIHRRVILIEKIWGRLGSLLLIGGSIGVILIAFFPDVHGADFFNDMSLGKIHVLISFFTVILFLAGFTVYGILFLVNAYPSIHGGKPDIYPNARTRYVFFAIAFFGLGTLITQIISNLRDYPWPGPGIYSFPLWEWFLSFTFFISIYWLAYTLPNEIPLSEKSSK